MPLFTRKAKVPLVSPLHVSSSAVLRWIARDTNDLGLLNQDYAYQMFQVCAPAWQSPYNWAEIESRS